MTFARAEHELKATLAGPAEWAGGSAGRRRCGGRRRKCCRHNRRVAKALDWWEGAAKLVPHSSVLDAGRDGTRRAGYINQGTYGTTPHCHRILRV